MLANNQISLVSFILFSLRFYSAAKTIGRQKMLEDSTRFEILSSCGFCYPTCEDKNSMEIITAKKEKIGLCDCEVTQKCNTLIVRFSSKFGVYFT